MAKSKIKNKDGKKKSPKDKTNQKVAEISMDQIPTKPDPFLPYDINQPRKERLSLVLDVNTKQKSSDNHIDKHSKSLPKVLPTHIIDALSAAPVSLHQIPAFNPETRIKESHVCIWEHFSKEDMKIFLKLRDNKDDLIYFFEKKFLVPMSQESVNGKSFELLFELLCEAARFSSITRMNERKTAALLSIIFLTHQNFKVALWQSAETTYKYMKEAFLLHTIQRPPGSAEIFSPEECRSALLYFCRIYLRNLPLVQLTMQPNYKLRMEWKPQISLDIPPKNEEKPKENEEKKGIKSQGKKGEEKGGKKGDKIRDKGKGSKKKK